MTLILDERMVQATFISAKKRVIELVEQGRADGTPFYEVVSETYERLTEFCRLAELNWSKEEKDMLFTVTRGRVTQLLEDLEHSYANPLPIDEQDTIPIPIEFPGGSEDSGVSPLQ